MIPPLELGGGNGAPLDVGGTLMLRLDTSNLLSNTEMFASLF